MKIHCRIRHELLLIVAVYLLSCAYPVQSMGRLFVTPEKRIQLDQGKLENADAPQEKVLDNQFLHVNGFVKPRNGANTIWVNGVRRPHQPATKYHVRQWVTPSLNISVDLQGARAQVSPGQTLDTENRVIVEAYSIAKQAEDEDIGSLVEDVSAEGGSSETKAADTGAMGQMKESLSVIKQAQDIGNEM